MQLASERSETPSQPNQGTATMTVRHISAVLFAIILVTLGCSSESPALAPATRTPATAVLAAEIDWQLSADGAQLGATSQIIPGQSTDTTFSHEYKDVTHTVSWRFVGHADGKDKYHFDMRLGTDDGIKASQKDIEYSGTEVLVYDSDNHKIVIRPKTP